MHGTFIMRYLTFGLCAAMVINFVSVAWAAQPVEKKGPELFVEKPAFIKQAPTKPIPLDNPFCKDLKKSAYICSFNALTQVLWRLAPLNDALKEAMQVGIIKLDNNIVRKYLASIQARETLQPPLYLKPFIDAVNKVATQQAEKDIQLADPLRIWEIFTEERICPEKIQALFCIRYREEEWCPQYIGNNKEHFSYEHDAKPFYISVHVAKGTDKLQEALNSYDGVERELNDTCNCGDEDKKCKEKKKRLIKLRSAPVILIINTDRSIPQSEEKCLLPYAFPFTGLKFGDKTYDLLGVIFHTGETRHAGHYYSWVEQNGEWYICNDTDIRSFSDKYFEEATHVDAHLKIPHKFTNLLIYMQKTVMQKLRLLESPFSKNAIPIMQKKAARAAWPPSAAKVPMGEITKDQFDAAQLAAINQKLLESYKRVETYAQ
jgi:hypothetical protein